MFSFFTLRLRVFVLNFLCLLWFSHVRSLLINTNRVYILNFSFCHICFSHPPLLVQETWRWISNFIMVLFRFWLEKHVVYIWGFNVSLKSLNFIQIRGHLAWLNFWMFFVFFLCWWRRTFKKWLFDQKKRWEMVYYLFISKNIPRIFQVFIRKKELKRYKKGIFLRKGQKKVRGGGGGDHKEFKLSWAWKNNWKVKMLVFFPSKTRISLL